MKPIACLIILSLIFAFWSNSFIGSTASEIPEGDVALEQPFDKLRPLLQRDQSPGPKWWTWDIWAEWLCPPRRNKPRRWRRLSFLLCKLRRRYRQRVQRWCRLRQEWRELMEGRLRAEPLPKDVRASIPLPGASLTVTPQPASNQETPFSDGGPRCCGGAWSASTSWAGASTNDHDRSPVLPQRGLPFLQHPGASS